MLQARRRVGKRSKSVRIFPRERKKPQPGNFAREKKFPW
jgi:hypothetical protein